MAATQPNTNYDGILHSIRDSIDAVYRKGIKQGRYLEQQERRKAEWISVEDRLPKKDRACLVFVDFLEDAPTVSIDRWDGNEWLRWPGGGITHWMPLPEAPKEE